MEEEPFISCLPLETDAQVYLYPPLSEIVDKNFTVHLKLMDKFKKNPRPFIREEKIAIQLAIQGLNVSSESLFSNHILTHPLVYVLLDRLGYPVNELAHPPSEIKVLSIYLKYPDFDMLLTLAAIVRFMSYQESEIFERNLRQDVIPSTTSIVSICDALTRKYKSGLLDMKEALRWLEESAYKKDILEYFERCSKTEAKHKALQKGMVGNVSINYIKIVVCGPPCVGKTAFKDLLANRPPLKKHHSTLIARPIHAIERIAAGGKVWEEITEKDILLMLSDIIRDTEITDPDAVPAATQSLSFTETAPTTTIAALPSIPKAFLSKSLPLLQTRPPIEAFISSSSPILQFASSLPAAAEKPSYSSSSRKLLQSTATITPPPMLPTTEAFYSASSPVLQIASTTALHTSIEEFTIIPSPVLQSTSTSPLPNEATNTKEFDYTSRKIMEQWSSEKREGSQMLHEATWIHLLDSGGQPQFTNLLRMFVRGNSLYIIVMKVIESLHDKPTFVYSIHGKPVTEPDKMTMTNLQIIESFVRSVAATSRENNSEPAFAIVATHCDKSKLKRYFGLEEKIREKNETLRSCLRDFLHLFVFYNHDSDELIFPVNNLCEENREIISANIRDRLVSDIRFNINIPVRWYVFDLNMKNEASKETHGMISFQSCYSIGHKLGMDKEEIDECLIYLDSMRLCIYYHKLLPHVVFTNPQFLIDCLSNIACVSFVDDLKQIFPEGVCLSTKFTEIMYPLKCRGTFDKALLHSLKSTLKFVPDLFSMDDLLTLLQHLLVISTIKGVQDIKYFIPILLPAEQKQKSFFAKSANSDPLLITFNDKLILQARD